MEYKIIEKVNIGGSDRICYRCVMKSKTYILVWDSNTQHHLKMQKHLCARGVGVPEIHWVDENSNLILMEDLGNDSLYELSKKKKRILSNYKTAIKELVKLQIDGYLDAPIKEYYDYEHIKWEQEYFKKYFLQQLCGVSKRTLRKLDGDLEALRYELIKVAEPWNNFLMHRDYQSQNIYIKQRKAKIIDYQSARFGPLTYDLVSLLKDCYVTITKEKEHELIGYYLECLKKKGIRFKKREFLHLYALTGLQRNMQALGAFSNLVLNKNKVHFKDYIPRGLQLLQLGLQKTEYSELSACVAASEVADRCRF